MTEKVKTREQLENIMRTAVSKILGIDENDNRKIRFGWGTSPATGSAPNWSRDSNTVFIYDLPVDDPVNRKRETDYINEGNDKLTYTDTHIDVHEFMFACYGPDSFNWARAIRNGIHEHEVSMELRKNDLFLVPDIQAPQVVPELYSGEWWDRTDVRIRFNERVKIVKENSVNPVESVDISAESADKTPKKKRGESNG